MKVFDILTEPFFKPLPPRQIRFDIHDDGDDENHEDDDYDNDHDDGDDHDHVIEDDKDLFQEALINERERGFRISYSLNPC